MNTAHSNRSLLNAVRTTVQEYRMIEGGAGVIVGVSGGPDSVALLHVLHLLSSEMKFWMVVAHVDHGLRPESQDDANFVKGIAEKLGVEFRIKTADVRALASGHGVSLEEAGRRCRYKFFEELRSSVSAEKIATAHHMDDELETFFLRVCRGSSLKGLCGIPAARGRIIRPMIKMGRPEILRFLEDKGIPFRIDPTNLQTNTDRNFIRNRLFAVITERFPGFRKTLGRTINTLRGEEEFAEEVSSNLYSKAIAHTDDELIIDIKALQEASVIPASRAIMSALYDFSGSDVRWGQSHLNLIMKVLRSRNPSSMAVLPDGILLLREYDVLRLSRNKPDVAVGTFKMSLAGPCMVEIPGGLMTLSFRLVEEGPQYLSYPQDPNEVYFDADQAPFPITLRFPTPGDRFRPWGLKGTCKLKKVLIDMKVPLGVRRKLPLVIKGEEIMWIPGIRRGQTAPVDRHTRRVLQVSLVRGFPPTLANTGFHSESRYEPGNQPFGLGIFFLDSFEIPEVV